MVSKPQFTNEAFREAIAAAESGRGRKLAQLLKAASIDDLTKAISYAGSHGYLSDASGHGLLVIMANVTGRRMQRDIEKTANREWRRNWRARQKAEAGHGQ